jgi:hypothetical protein
MAWFAAHSIMSVEFIDGNQNKYPIWENIILIEATTDEEALEKAKIRSREDESELDDNFTWEDRPALLVFSGIRKLISFSNSEEQPSHGVEISYSQMEVTTKDELFRLVKGESVIVTYEE